MKVTTYIKKVPEKTTKMYKAFEFRIVEFPELSRVINTKTVVIQISNRVIKRHVKSRKTLYIQVNSVDYNNGIVFN